MAFLVRQSAGFGCLKVRIQRYKNHFLQCFEKEIQNVNHRLARKAYSKSLFLQCQRVRQVFVQLIQQYNIVQAIHAWIATLILATVTLITLTLSFSTAWRHLASFTNERQQRYIIRILLFPSVYSILSTISFYFVQTAPYFEVIAVAYEVLTVYSLFKLLIAYLGPQGSLMTFLGSNMKGRKRCCGFLNPSPSGFIKWIYVGILQFTFLKPLLTIMLMIYTILNAYCYNVPANPDWIVILSTILTLIAVICITSFLRTIKDGIPKDIPYVTQFLCIKGSIFILTIQRVTVSHLANVGKLVSTDIYSQENVAESLLCILIVAEMLILAILQSIAFPSAPYMSETKISAKAGLWNVVDLSDLGNDLVVCIKTLVGSKSLDPSESQVTIQGEEHV